MKYLLTTIIILLQISLIAQTNTEQVNKLLQRKAELKRSISFYQNELKEVELKIQELEQAPVTPTIVSESGEKIVATVGANGAVLRMSPNVQSTELMQIPANETVYVHKEQQGLYFKATYYGKEGWISYTNIESHPEIEAIVSKRIETNTATRVFEVDETDPKYQRLLKIYGKEKAVKIVSKQLWKGMTHGQLKESLGKPLSQTRENSAKGLKEVWTYSEQEIIFLNGTLLSW